jgi:four helix bundle protein
MSSHHFENWDFEKRASKPAVDACLSLYQSRDYSQKPQAQRSATSIPANLTKGAERLSDADFLRLFSFSMSSCRGLIQHLQPTTTP